MADFTRCTCCAKCRHVDPLCPVHGDITIRVSTSPFCTCGHAQRYHEVIRGCSWMDCDCKRFAAVPAAASLQEDNR